MIAWSKTSRGFELGEFLDAYGHPATIQQSSATDLEHAPGGTFLWLGHTAETRLHLNRVQVTEIRDAMTRWLETGSLLSTAVEVGE